MEKARIRLLFVVVLHICFTSGSVLGDAPTEGLIGYWMLDEGGGITAYDSAGDNDGTLVNGPFWTSGLIDGALNFDGFNDYVDLGNDNSLKPPLPVTLSAWIRFSQNGKTLVGLDDCSSTYYGVWMDIGGTNRLSVAFGDGNGWGDPAYRRGKGGTTVLNADTWYHVAGVVRGATDMSLYINGTDEGGSYSGTGGSLAYSSGNASIGTKHHANICFDGKIDDVRVYDRALSAEEVQGLYLEGGLPVAHWKFDEGEGDIVYDSAGDNDGTIYGADWTIGIIDGALDFDGDEDHVDFGDIDELEFGDSNFAISAWFYGTGVYPDFDGVLVSKYNYDDFGRQWYLKQDEAGYIYFYTSPDGSTHELLASQQNAYLNQWVHVVGVRDGSTKVLYLNGLLDAAQSTAGVVTGKSSKVYVGCSDHPSGLSRCFSGTIDDVRVYDRALSAEEIQELYPGGLAVAVDIKPGSCPNPLNVKSKGVLPVAILGTEDLDVNSIDAVSVRLAGVEPLRSSYEDVASLAVDGNECPCSEEGPDGYTDLTLKFETQKVVEALGEVNDGDVLMVTLTGVLGDGTPIEGTDCIVIRGRFKPFNRGDINKDGITDIVDFAMMAGTWLESTDLD